MAVNMNKRFKCLIEGHKFKRILRQNRGVYIERFVQCQQCKMVIAILSLHPKFYDISDPWSRDKQYMERRKLNIRKARNERINYQRMAKILFKQ
jgi:hypothetical protein